MMRASTSPTLNQKQEHESGSQPEVLIQGSPKHPRGKTAQRLPKRFVKNKKAPGAPKRFRPAFIFFSAEKHKEIRARLGYRSSSESTATISKLVSQAWKALTPVERAKWEKLEQEDKERYNIEKMNYHGPWRVPASMRQPQDTDAPKRPMSAYLAFANSRRAAVKCLMRQGAPNGEISKVLAAMWREAPEILRQEYCKEASEKMKKHTATFAEWKMKKVQGDKKGLVDGDLLDDLDVDRLLEKQIVTSLVNDDDNDSILGSLCDDKGGGDDDEGVTSVIMMQNKVSDESLDRDEDSIFESIYGDNDQERTAASEEGISAGSMPVEGHFQMPEHSQKSDTDWTIKDTMCMDEEQEIEPLPLAAAPFSICLDDDSGNSMLDAFQCNMENGKAVNPEAMMQPVAMEHLSLGLAHNSSSSESLGRSRSVVGTYSCLRQCQEPGSDCIRTLESIQNQPTVHSNSAGHAGLAESKRFNLHVNNVKNVYVNASRPGSVFPCQNNGIHPAYHCQGSTTTHPQTIMHLHRNTHLGPHQGSTFFAGPPPFSCNRNNVQVVHLPPSAMRGPIAVQFLPFHLNQMPIRFPPYSQYRSMVECQRQTSGTNPFSRH